MMFSALTVLLEIMMQARPVHGEDTHAAYIFLSVYPSVAIWNLVGWWLCRINQGILFSLVHYQKA